MLAHCVCWTRIQMTAMSPVFYVDNLHQTGAVWVNRFPVISPRLPLKGHNITQKAPRAFPLTSETPFRTSDHNVI